MNLLASGWRAKQIAYQWGVSLATIRAAIMHAKRKTGARTISELVALVSEDATRDSRARASRPTPQLTSRQLQVIALLSDGQRANEIANTLGISPRQVRRLVEQALNRSGAVTTAELVGDAVRLLPEEIAEAERGITIRQAED